MLSRVADSFYWVGRYLERAEHTSRVLTVHLSLLLDDPTNTIGRSLLVAVGAIPPAPATEGAEPPAANHLDPAHRTAVADCVGNARENGRQIREQISSEMWEQLNRIYLLVREAETPGSAVGRGAFLRSVIDGVHQFHGVTEATLSRGEGWQYLELGRYLERATSTAALLETYFNDPEGAASDLGRPGGSGNAIGLLRACAAFEPYCRVYTNDVTPERLAEFLLLNAEFPRSVRFAIDRLEDALRAIARLLGRQATGTPERYAGQLRAALNYGQIDEIMADNLIRYVQGIRKRCDQVHDAVYQTYMLYTIETAIPR